MRNYELEFKNRVEFIKNMLEKTKATGIVFGNSGGKDSALVGILCHPHNTHPALKKKGPQTCGQKKPTQVTCRKDHQISTLKH